MEHWLKFYLILEVKFGDDQQCTLAQVNFSGNSDENDQTYSFYLFSKKCC